MDREWDLWSLEITLMESVSVLRKGRDSYLMDLVLELKCSIVFTLDNIIGTVWLVTKCIAFTIFQKWLEEWIIAPGYNLNLESIRHIVPLMYSLLSCHVSLPYTAVVCDSSSQSIARKCPFLLCSLEIFVSVFSLLWPYPQQRTRRNTTWCRIFL